MELRAFYNQFLKELRPVYGYEETTAMTTMIFEEFAGKTKTDIITDPGYVIEPEKLSALEAALLQLKRQVPVQYIIGHAWFAGLKFKVSPAVLIPRPETEELVNEALKFMSETDVTNALDIGTGSGCIPITIKKKLPHIHVTAIDISPAALEIARTNSQENGVAIEWIEVDFLEGEGWANLGKYDVIISNPPYIPEREKELLDENVTAHEPNIALFVPDNKALIFYEKIAAFGILHLAKGGMIFMETHESFARQVADLFSMQGYRAEVKKDMFEKERMVIANRFH
ncbi:MAG: peptide chain release factor N(5)-glutamine methyltransferase [Chitinophagaceae bacterium]|nr:MAG: peptide chain release factor N(5)-glutamine methyltransferase [Chitinophagaceae bacterium]